MKFDHRSTSMRTSYTDAGVAVDGCSTLIDTEVGMTRNLLPPSASRRESTQANLAARRADLEITSRLARHQGANLFELRSALDDFERSGEPAACLTRSAARRQTEGLPNLSGPPRCSAEPDRVECGAGARARDQGRMRKPHLSSSGCTRTKTVVFSSPLYEPDRMPTALAVPSGFFT